MDPAEEPAPGDPAASGRSLVAVCAVAAVAGVAVGFVGGAFRWGLERAAEGRLDLLAWVRAAPGPAWLVPVAVTAAGAGLARLVVRWVPMASGSGIQHVEAVDRDQVPPPSWSVLPGTFVGGLLGIGGGLVLGREGPTVHMGAVVGAVAARWARRSHADVRLLQTALAGAGLAVAFDAPLGGALFALEEVARSFRPRLMLATLTGCVVAVACSQAVLGDRPDFVVAPGVAPPGGLLVVFVLFGAGTGLLGAVYNRLVVGFLALADRVTAVGPVARATVIGAVVGAALVADPLVAGGGDSLSQRLVGGEAFVVPALAGYLAVRFVAGPLSYAAGTPGGLFAPLLALGALWGALVHAALAGWVPGLGDSPATLAVVGMAALFTASVRAPLTGVVLIIEMTAAAWLTVPLVAATAGALLATTLVRSAPIYDSLRERLLGEPGLLRELGEAPPRA